MGTRLCFYRNPYDNLHAFQAAVFPDMSQWFFEIWEKVHSETPSARKAQLQLKEDYGFDKSLFNLFKKLNGQWPNYSDIEKKLKEPERTRLLELMIWDYDLTHHHKKGHYLLKECWGSSLYVSHYRALIPFFKRYCPGWAYDIWMFMFARLPNDSYLAELPPSWENPDCTGIGYWRWQEVRLMRNFLRKMFDSQGQLWPLWQARIESVIDNPRDANGEVLQVVLTECEILNPHEDIVSYEGLIMLTS